MTDIIAQKPGEGSVNVPLKILNVTWLVRFHFLGTNVFIVTQLLQMEVNIFICLECFPIPHQTMEKKNSKLVRNKIEDKQNFIPLL